MHLSYIPIESGSPTAPAHLKRYESKAPTPMLKHSLLSVLFILAGCATTSEDPFAVISKNCAARSNAAACASAGDYLWENNGKKLVACTSATYTVCIRPGEDRAAAVARIDELAYQFHEKACASQHAEACNKAGVHFAVQYAGASDQEAPALAAKAESRFRKACDLGSKEGCGNVGSTRPAR